MVSGKKRGVKSANFLATRIYISASYNNTIISVADSAGNIITWASAGLLGFKGPKKSTPYAASKVIESIFERLGGNTALGRVSLFVHGVGSGRDAAIRGFVSKGLDIVSIQDTTPIPHNGCRPRKARRV